MGFTIFVLSNALDIKQKCSGLYPLCGFIQLL